VAARSQVAAGEMIVGREQLLDAVRRVKLYGADTAGR
jgi:hypothetical protein